MGGDGVDAAEGVDCQAVIKQHLFCKKQLTNQTPSMMR